MSDAEAETNRRKGIRLSELDWQKIVALWETGSVRGHDLAAQFGVTPESISRGLSKRKAVYGKHAAAAAKKVVEAAQDDTEITVRRAKETREEHYKISRLFAQMAAMKIQQAEKKVPGYSYDQANDELKAIQAAMTISEKSRRERWAILGLDKDNAIGEEDMPELLIREMTGKEVEDSREAQEAALREIGALEVAQEDELDPDFSNQGDDE